MASKIGGHSIFLGQKVWSARRNRAALHIIPIWSMEWQAKLAATPHYLLTMKKSRSLAAGVPKKPRFLGGKERWSRPLGSQKAPLFGEEERQTERKQKDRFLTGPFAKSDVVAARSG